MFKIFSYLAGFLSFKFNGYSNTEDDPFYSDGDGFGLGDLHGTIDGNGYSIGYIGFDDVGYGEVYGFEDGDGRVKDNTSLLEESNA